MEAGFGFVVGKSASPSSTPGSAFLCCSFRTTVESAGTANRTSRVQRGKRTGFWHTVQFSRCERRPEGRDSKEMGRATHHGRHVSVRRQPRPVTRPGTPPARHDRSRNPSRRRPVAVDRNEQGPATPDLAGRRGPIGGARGGAPASRYPSRANPRRPTWSTRPLSSLAGNSSASPSTGCPSSRTPPCSIKRRAWEFESARPRTARSFGR